MGDDDFDSKMLAWALDSELQDAVQFHNLLRSLLKKHYRDIASDHAPVGYVERLKQFDEMHVANTFLLAFSILEEMLFLLWRTRAPAIIPNKRGDALDRYAPVLQALGVKVGALPCWADLRTAETIRHCLLHANGRITAMSTPGPLRRKIRKHPGELFVEGDRVIVHPSFLARSVDAIEKLRKAVLGA